MEIDDYNESQQSDVHHKKKKKAKKAKEILEAAEELNEEYTQEEDTSMTSRSKKKKKHSRSHRSPTPTADPLEDSLKQEPPTPVKSKVPGVTSGKGKSGSGTTKKDPPVNPGNGDLDGGINLIAAMSFDDIELFLQQLEAECPVNDNKKAGSREELIDWSKLSVSCYGPQQLKSVWSYLMNQTRKFRIMHELVQEVKYNLKADYRKFMKKNIESAPGFPKQPYATGGFQFFCKQKWDQYKNLQESMNKKVENFLNFQRKCHQTWEKLDDNLRKDYDQKAKLLQAEYKQKVREFYENYPGFLSQHDKLNKDGKPETKDKPMSDYYRKQAIKMSNELFQDAPKIPLTPMQLYIQHKIKRTQPEDGSVLLPHEEAELKGHYVGTWKDLSGDKKRKWIRKCIKYCERYQLDVAEYKSSHPMFLLPKEFQISKLISKEEMKIWTEEHGQPPKPKNTVYELFLHDYRSSAEAENRLEEEILQTAAEKWKNLPAVERERYKLNFKMQRLNFKGELEEYLATVPDILRMHVIEGLPKPYKTQFLEQFNKDPLVTDNDVLEMLDDDGGTRKRKNTEGSESQDGDGATKKKKMKGAADEDNLALPLYAEELTNEHIRLIDEQLKGVKSSAAAGGRKGQKEAVETRNDYFPGKDISPRMIYEAIRGVFDGRQHERSFSVYYFYAKYVAGERSWELLYPKIGVVETAARIIETFNRLPGHQQQLFLDEAYRFHSHTRFYDKQVSTPGELSAPTVSTFPGEPIPPPRKAAHLYKKSARIYEAGAPPPPPWEKLDEETQMTYMKKLYFLHRRYITEYEKFVRNMAPNDVVEYLLRKSVQWNNAKNRSKRQNFSNLAILAGAEEGQTREVSEEWSNVELPELFLTRDQSSRKDLQVYQYRYQPNPFRTKKAKQKQGDAFMKRLCDAKYDSDLPSDSTSDEDELEYGHLSRSEAEREKDKRFRRKLREMQGYYYYPLGSYYEKSHKPKGDTVKRVTKRSKLKKGTLRERNWAKVRELINSKPGSKGDPPQGFLAIGTAILGRRKQRVEKAKATVGRVQERNSNANRPQTRATSKGKTEPRGKVPIAPKRGQLERPRKTEDPPSRREEPVALSEDSDDMEVPNLPEYTTPFIQTAVALPDRSPDNMDEFEKQLLLMAGPPSTSSWQPGFMLVEPASQEPQLGQDYETSEIFTEFELNQSAVVPY